MCHREQPPVSGGEEQDRALVRGEGTARIGREDRLRLTAGVLTYHVCEGCVRGV